MPKTPTANATAIATPTAAKIFVPTLRLAAKRTTALPAMLTLPVQIGSLDAEDGSCMCIGNNTRCPERLRKRTSWFRDRDSGYVGLTHRVPLTIGSG